jgi:hypothetical protein
MTKKNIPFDFVFDYLLPIEVRVKPMFGLFAIYAGEKIVLMLRQKTKHQEMNGVWIATTKEHHKSLKKDFPSLQSIPLFSKDSIDETQWQLLPVDSEDFENAVIKVCEFIKHNDQRIGRIPKPRNAKTKSRHSKKHSC